MHTPGRFYQIWEKSEWKRDWESPTIPRTPDSECSLLKPLHMWIRPGTVATIPCPVHGSHEIKGSAPTFGL